MLAAKKFLEEEIKDFVVLKCYLSPSCDSYVYDKAKRYNFKQFFLDFDARCKLLEACIAERGEEQQQTLAIDRWEGSNNFFIDFPQVAGYTKEYL
jgi:hypothetical protein